MSKRVRQPPRLPVEEIVLILMVILALLGLAVTDFSPRDAFMYWMSMYFVFGLAAMVVGWYHAKRHRDAVPGEDVVRELFKVQALHWLGSLLTVVCLFSFVEAGHLTQEATGLMVLLMLALATFLDGIRIGWRFSLAGVYLAVAVVAANLLDHFLVWLVVLAVVVILITLYLERRGPVQDGREGS